MKESVNGSLLVAESVTKQVNSPEGILTILDRVSFSVAARETVAVVGASGSGKSTLLGLLAGLDLPSHGHVLLNGVDLNQLDEDGRAGLRARAVGFVFQSFHLLPALTALENVQLPLELAGEDDASKIAAGILEDIGLGERLGHYPNQLSGGEQQRVAIARAFSTQPNLLFADEPTGNLDTTTGTHIIDLLFDLNRKHGTTLIMVTHNDKLASRCDRVLKLVAGCLDPTT
ncbi:MAG: ATP-binding cassette domain-containing protein [Gammaproteobacteria bacterium]